MKEVTRVHIAKVAYDIDIAAKKQLEKYLHELESYAGNAEIVADVEARIIELLAERKVLAGDVITVEDVDAIQDKLGEPYEFAEDSGDIAVGNSNPNNNRRLFRSTHDAILGGVLSGIAAYLKVNPLWVRLVFIVLLFMSFGVVVFAYIILWIVVPPVRSASDLLHQEGVPVNLKSIRKIDKIKLASATANDTPVLVRVLGLLFGVGALLGALGVFAAVVLGLSFGQQKILHWLSYNFAGDELSLSSWSAYWVIIAGLLLMMSLFCLIAYAFFARKVTRRIVISGIVIAVLGLTALATTIGVVVVGQEQARDEVARMMRSTNGLLPKDFANITSLEIDTKSAPGVTIGGPYGLSTIDYRVQPGGPHYDMRTMPGVLLHTTIDGQTAKLTIEYTAKFIRYQNFYSASKISIYGPALTQIKTGPINLSYHAPRSQQSLDVVTQADQGMMISGGSITSVLVSGSGSASMTESSIKKLEVRGESGLSVDAGNVGELSLDLPDVCPIYSQQSTVVTVAGVADNRVTYNGRTIRAESMRTNCAELVVGDEGYN